MSTVLTDEARELFNNAVQRAVQLTNDGKDSVKQVSIYLNANYIVRATRIFKPRANEKTVDLRLTFGRPNYAERAKVKQFIKRGFPFMGIDHIKKFPNKKKGSK